MRVTVSRRTETFRAGVAALGRRRRGRQPGDRCARPGGQLLQRQLPGGAQSHRWHTVHDLRPEIAVVEPTLVHVDYWSGNLLGSGDQVSAVVDWEEAGYGDPAIDVAYSVMELFLEGLDDDADDFLRTYHRETGRTLANLAYWKLAASARPMMDLDGWLSRRGWPSVSVASSSTHYAKPASGPSHSVRLHFCSQRELLRPTSSKRARTFAPNIASGPVGKRTVRHGGVG